LIESTGKSAKSIELPAMPPAAADTTLSIYMLAMSVTQCQF